MDAAKGSSPRMRGAPGHWSLGDSQWRIIPADAGSTIRPMVVAPYTEDHPRGCGEHWASCLAAVTPPGSSPRMRGALAKIRHDLGKVRIIPADAGSTVV